MRTLPLVDPGVPDVRGPGRFLWWLTRRQAWLMIGSAALGVLWLGTQALMPAILGRALDAGVTAKDTAALLLWSGALLAAGVFQAVTHILRHRMSVMCWIVSAFRTVQLVTRKAAGLGATLPKKVASGEVVSVGTADIDHIGSALEICGRAAGAVGSFVIVAVVLLNTSTSLGLLVLIGVPVLVLVISPLLRPLQRRQADHRARIGELSTLGSDIVVGLRVLRGVGGEDAFHARYRDTSQTVRAAGVRVGRVEALLDGAQVLLPGLFVVALVWAGARLAIAGEISIGELVAFYGYAAFLVEPLHNATEAVRQITRGLVASRRAIRVLSLTSDLAEASDSPAGGGSDGGADDGSGGAELRDPATGFVGVPGRLTVVASSRPEDAAALADRLGRYVDADVTLGGVRLDAMALADVRRRILVADTEATLFSGVLADELDPTGTRDEDEVHAMIEAASAADVLDALPDGLDTEVEERGRSFSGGQRQRLLLVRALLADPEVLVLVEPTSAVDAHTEARIADRLRATRERRTTIVCSTSPLVLDRADQVVFLDEGRVAAVGEHAELLGSEPAYRAVVLRGEDEAEDGTENSENTYVEAR